MTTVTSGKDGMFMDKEKLMLSFDFLESGLINNDLPKWEDFPDIELYMDQVISLITKYLDGYFKTIGSEKAITPSMINNYVKLGIVPPPKKKKYSRLQLAYLIMICTLKQTMDMATISKAVPVDAEPEYVREMYNRFVEIRHKAAVYVTESMRSFAEDAFGESVGTEEGSNELLMSFATAANIFKMLTDNIIKGTEITESE